MLCTLSRKKLARLTPAGQSLMCSLASCGGNWTQWPASAARTGRAGSSLQTRYSSTLRPVLSKSNFQNISLFYFFLCSPQGTSSQLGDRCQTEEKTTCVTTANSTGKMEVTYQSGACCIDRSASVKPKVTLICHAVSFFLGPKKPTNRSMAIIPNL